MTQPRNPTYDDYQLLEIEAHLGTDRAETNRLLESGKVPGAYRDIGGGWRMSRNAMRVYLERQRRKA